jgi:hypothetical protein
VVAAEGVLAVPKVIVMAVGGKLLRMNVFWLVLGPLFLVFGGAMIVNRERIPTWQQARGMTRTQSPMLYFVLGGMFGLLGMLWLIDGIMLTV